MKGCTHRTKESDALLYIIFVNAKLLLPQIRHISSGGIRNNYRNRDQVRIDFERFNLLRRIGWRGCGLSRLRVLRLGPGANAAWGLGDDR